MKKIIAILLLCAGISHVGHCQTANGSFTQQPCNNDGVFTVVTSGFNLPLTFTYWFPMGVTYVHSNVNSATDQLTNIPWNGTSTINCIVSDGNSWIQVSDTITPPFEFSITATNPICPAFLGNITATYTGGSPGPFTYSWYNNTIQQPFSGNNLTVPMGYYSATITDQVTGCSLDIDTVAFIQQISDVTASITETDANCTNGTATAVPSGGSSPYTFLWANGATSASISGLSLGNYSLTVTDANGCQSSNLNAHIDQTPWIGVNTTVTDANCTQADGSAIAFGSGGVSPYTYSWNNGQTGDTLTGLFGPAGYNVIATDANGCVGSGYANIGSSTPISVTYTSTPSQCTASTGSATLNPTGGTLPYSYSWNSNPAITGATVSNVPAGDQWFTVTDAVGCVRTGNAVVNPISDFSVYTQATNAVCPITTGSVSMTAYSGTNPPYTYLWSTGATTSQITGVNLGNYSCVITDALGCEKTKSAIITQNSPLNIAVSTTDVSCLYANDGAATVTVTGGTAPYIYSFSNGATTSSVTGLAMGYNTVLVTDANGCSKSQFFQIGNANTSTSCYCTIEGHVFVDTSADCIFDTGEIGVQNVMMHCSGQGYSFTDANGYYSFQVPSGSYTISEQVNAYYPLALCQSNAVPVTVVAGAGCNSVVDIANVINPIHDLKILTVSSTVPPVPGNQYQQQIIVQNIGTLTESGVQLGYQHDGQLPYINSASPSMVQINPVTVPHHYSVQTGFPSLSPNATNVTFVNFNTPTNIPIGTVINFHDSVAHMAPIATNWTLDYSPWNNVHHYQPAVLSSYDPNYKTVSPTGIGTPGYIASTTTEFDYVIHFQNEGTYFAQNIVITDQLDADLDWTTLRPGYSEYPYTATVSESGLVTFTFADIHLPWKSLYGDILSSSFISYSVDRLSTSPQGTEFTNTANIYFDYNAPIITNTTLNTLNDEMADLEDSEVIENYIDGVTVDLYPVPTNEIITIRIRNVSRDQIGTWSIFDLTGKTILTETISLNAGTNIITEDISNLENGTYLTRIQFEDGSFVVKKIIFSN